jgi:hypothetical protein
MARVMTVIWKCQNTQYRQGLRKYGDKKRKKKEENGGRYEPLDSITENSWNTEHKVLMKYYLRGTSWWIEFLLHNLVT